MVCLWLKCRKCCREEEDVHLRVKERVLLWAERHLGVKWAKWCELQGEGVSTISGWVLATHSLSHWEPWWWPLGSWSQWCSEGQREEEKEREGKTQISLSLEVSHGQRRSHRKSPSSLLWLTKDSWRSHEATHLISGQSLCPITFTVICTDARALHKFQKPLCGLHGGNTYFYMSNSTLILTFTVLGGWKMF